MNTNAPTAVVAEDELPLRDQLLQLLARVWPELRIVALAEDGIDALRHVQTLRPDIAFLDVQMPGITGLEAAAQIGPQTLVVFITAYAEHAVTAFEHEAVDYLLKPISAARLVETVGRLRRRLQARESNHETRQAAALTSTQPPTTRGLRWITAADGEELRLITIEEILYLEADNKVVTIVTPSGRFALRRALRDLVAELDEEQFWQVHRAFVVNSTCVSGITRDFRGKMRLRLRDRPETLPVSDHFAERFRSR
jgi:DNA-binding LytR/AlgR family response regulator